MDQPIDFLFALASTLAPVAAYLWTARRPRPTVGSLVVAAALTGFMVGLCFFALHVVSDWHQAFNSALYPWILAFTAWGALIGTAGVLARVLGRVWSMRL
ncbi:MAG: hypothetical protein M3P51_16150 [Chloroflexota bacterium]|nr:hypothetical protein [Chloroflexota bacterium]